MEGAAKRLCGRVVLQVVETGGGVAEDFRTGGWGVFLDVLSEGLADLVVGGGDEADGPVGAEHEAVGTESFEGGVKKWREIGGLPAIPVGVGDQAGNFGVNVGIRSEFFDLRGPTCRGSRAHIGLSEMVDDEFLLRELGDEFDRGGKLTREDE